MKTDLEELQGQEQSRWDDYKLARAHAVACRAAWEVTVLELSRMEFKFKAKNKLEMGEQLSPGRFRAPPEP